MVYLTRHIEYLLTDHDCVVVPGLGAILGIHEPAALDVEKGKLLPPRRRYAFNSDLVESDGLLVSSISRSKDIDFKQAFNIVEKEVAQLRSELDNSGEVTIGRIGRLEKLQNGLIMFVPFDRDMLTPLADWLPVINAPRLITEKPIEVNSQHLSETYGKKDGRVRRFIRNTVGAAAAIFLGLTVSTPVTVNHTLHASLEPPTIKMSVVEDPQRDNVAEMPLSQNKGKVQSTTAETQETDQAESIIPKKEVSVLQGAMKPDISSPRFEDTDNYILVVGSLTSGSDVDDYISMLSRRYKDLKFGKVKHGNRIRIFAATGETPEQARLMSRNETISTHFKDAWVTQRKI